MHPLSERFITRIRNCYGEQGISWLSTLPELRDTLLERWSLQESQPVEQLSYNYLEYAHSPEHGPIVLKIGVPNPELYTEIKALECYLGVKGAVRLLDWDIEKGAILLERITPGYNLTTLADERLATQIAANAMVSLRQPKPEGSDFPSMGKWCLGFSRYQESFPDDNGPLPGNLFNEAYGLARELLQSKEEQYLLHGDLHHSNLLFREDDSWIAIDPKGIIGEFACEIGPYLYNPIPELIKRPNLDKILEQRLGILVEISGLDRQRLAAWSFCRSVLSAIWSVEEWQIDLSYWVEISQAIRRLLK